MSPAVVPVRHAAGVTRTGGRRRWTAGAVLLAVGLLATGPSTAGPASAGVPVTAGCPGQAAPPGPPVPEELRSGPPPAPLPVPDPAVSGLDACADAHTGRTVAPPTGAASYVVADLATGAVLATRAPHSRQRPASTIKLLLALVVTDRLAPDRVVAGTVQDANIEGSRAGVGPGGRYTVTQLLQGLLLASGNDCANALARELGGVPATLAAMRDTAARLGALDTRPATPSGLDGPGMSSSAHDLAVIYREALTRPAIATTLRTASVPFPGFAGRPGFELGNDDRMLGSPGFLGGKNGFTDAARHTFVGGAERGGRRLVVALVRGEQRPVRMVDQARALLDWGFTVPADAPALGALAPPGPDPADAPEPAGAARGPRAAPPDAGPRDGPVGATVAALAGVGAVVASLGLVTSLELRRRRRD